MEVQQQEGGGVSDPHNKSSDFNDASLSELNNTGKQDKSNVNDEEDNEVATEPPPRGPHELDCPLCQQLLHEPVTTSCGHNFCKSCIIRAQDYSTKCPICRAPMATIGPQHAVNSLLKTLAIAAFPHEYKHRASEFRLEERQACQNMPLFVLRDVVVFPRMPLRLHVFEQRYINLMKHVLEGSRTFGMIVPGYEVGCLVVLENYYPIPDGRSMVNLRGTLRFRVAERWVSEGGFEMAKISTMEDEDKDIDDEGKTVNNNNDSTLRRRHPSQQPQQQPQQPQQPQQQPTGNNYEGYPGNYNTAQQHGPSVQTAPTTNNNQEGEETKETLAAQVVALLQSKLKQNELKSLETKYGNLPHHNPEQLSYWLATVLPINVTAKQQLLECKSSKERLYIAKQHLLRANQLVRPSGPQQMYSWIFFILLFVYLWFATTPSFFIIF